jgi:protein SCO1/2
MSTQRAKNHKKLLFSLIFIFLVIPAVVIYFGVINHQNKTNAKDIKIDGLVIAPAKDVIDFHLTDSSGKAFSKENLKGHWTMMFFGFTNCGLVCPTTMSALNKMYQTLQTVLPEDKLPQVVMVSVDPERDTVTKMKNYVSAFNSHFMGIRGDMTETTALERQFHIVAVKTQTGKGKNQYYYDHSAEILVFNPEGKLQAYMSYPHKPEEMVKDYQSILTIG